MARAGVWAFGESPQTAGATYNGDEGIQSLTSWDRETTIKPTPWASASYGKNHNAGNLTATVSPTGKTVNAVALAAAKVGITFACYFSDVTPADYIRFVSFQPTSGAAGVINLTLNPSNLALTDSSVSVLQSVATPISDATWAWFRVTQEYDSGASQQRTRVWLWGSSDPTDSSGWGSAILDYTASSITSTIGRIDFSSTAPSKGGSTPNTHHYMAQGYEFTFGSDPDLPAAPAVVYRLAPDGNSATNVDFSGSGTGSNPDWNDVKEMPSDGDTSYDGSKTTATTDRQTYTLAASPSLTGYTVEGVQACVQVAGVSSPTAQGLVRDNSTNTASGSTFGVGTTYGVMAWFMPTAPSDSSAWDATRIGTLEVGMQKASIAGKTCKITQAFALVVAIPAVVAAGQPMMIRSARVPHMALGQTALRRRN